MEIWGSLSPDAADLVQEVAERILDVMLRFRGRAIEIELELAFHEMHQLFVALAQMLVPHQGIVDHLQRGHDAEAGIRFGVVVLRGAGQRMHVPPPALPRRLSRGRPPRAPQRLYPPACGGSCPAPATGARR